MSYAKILSMLYLLHSIYHKFQYLLSQLSLEPIKFHSKINFTNMELLLI